MSDGRRYQLLRSKTGRKGMRVSATVDIPELRKGLSLWGLIGREEYIRKYQGLMTEAAGKVERFPCFAKWQDPEHVAEALRVAGWLYDEHQAASVAAEVP